MNSTAARQGLQTAANGHRGSVAKEVGRAGPVGARDGMRGAVSGAAGKKARIYVAAENRLMQEALSRMLIKSGDLDAVGSAEGAKFQAEFLLQERADLLLLTSRGSLAEDIILIRQVRATASAMQILLIGGSGDEAEFLQCVRAGVRGYLLRDASAEEVLEGVRAVQAGKAVCPGNLCALLFRYFEQEANSLPSPRMHEQLGLTRREQQLIPLIAEGLTNKEIANHFCLSEQTIKNHLYRMKNKVGAGDRFGIVQTCRMQGFLL